MKDRPRKDGDSTQKNSAISRPFSAFCERYLARLTFNIAHLVLYRVFTQLPALMPCERVQGFPSYHRARNSNPTGLENKHVVIGDFSSLP